MANEDTPSEESPFEKLTRAQVFARDPENLTHEHLVFALAEIRKIMERNRKARADTEAVQEMASKLKKTNAAARKKKAPAGPLPSNIMDIKL